MARDFAEALQRQLDAAGKTGYRLSLETGLSKQLVSKLLNRQAQPGWETVAKIAKALGVSCEAFLSADIDLPDVPDQRKAGRPPRGANDGGRPVKAKPRGKGKGK